LRRIFRADFAGNRILANPAGAVVGDYDRFGALLFRTLSKIWLVARIAAAAIAVQPR
jgi:hypothetical protein